MGICRAQDLGSNKIFEGPHNKDYCISGVYIGVLLFRETTIYCFFRHPLDAKRYPQVLHTATVISRECVSSCFSENEGPSRYHRHGTIPTMIAKGPAFIQPSPLLRHSPKSCPRSGSQLVYIVYSGSLSRFHGRSCQTFLYPTYITHSPFLCTTELQFVAS